MAKVFPPLTRSAQMKMLRFEKLKNEGNGPINHWKAAFNSTHGHQTSQDDRCLNETPSHHLKTMIKVPSLLEIQHIRLINTKRQCLRNKKNHFLFHTQVVIRHNNFHPETLHPCPSNKNKMVAVKRLKVNTSKRKCLQK